MCLQVHFLTHTHKANARTRRPSIEKIIWAFIFYTYYFYEDYHQWSIICDEVDLIELVSDRAGLPTCVVFIRTWRKNKHCSSSNFFFQLLFGSSSPGFSSQLVCNCMFSRVRFVCVFYSTHLFKVFCYC